MSSTLPSITPPISLPTTSTHIASRSTTLRFKNHGSGGSTVTDTTDSTAQQDLFRIGAKKNGMTSTRREIRDSKDTLLFELRRDFSGYCTFLEPPGAGSGLPGRGPVASFEPLATGFKDKFDVMLHSGSADPEGSTTAAEAEDDVKLEVRGQDIWKRNALVYRGEEIVMQARFVNLLTCYVPFKSNEWDVYVAEGMDLSLAAAIMAYLAASLYDSADFGIMNRMIGGGKGTNDKRSSLNKHVMMGATAGAAAGSGGGSC